MGIERWLAAAASALLVISVARAQVYEDRMDPFELGIGDLDSLAVPESAYVGNDTCRACHEDAYRLWLGTRHARAFVPLRSRISIAMGQQDAVTTDSPAESGKCLSCHATGHDVSAEYRNRGFRMREGVTCEKCHGPGGQHVGAMESRVGKAIASVSVGLRRTIRTLLAGGDGAEGRRKAWEPNCAGCHNSVLSHEMLGSKPFAFSKAWKTIAH